MKQRLVVQIAPPGQPMRFKSIADVPVIAGPHQWTVVDCTFHTVGVRNPDGNIGVVHVESGLILGNMADNELKGAMFDFSVQKAAEVIIANKIKQHSARQIANDMKRLTTLEVE